VLRIKKKASLSRSTSQSSFQSCNDDEDDQNIEEEEEYTWKTPTVLVHNVIFGRLWCEFQGQIDLKHTQSDRRAVLTIKSHSWFASQSAKNAEMFKFTGFIYDGKEKLGAFHGNYGHCYYAIDNLDDLPLKTSSHCSSGGDNCIHLNSNTLVPTACDLILTPSSRLIWYRSLSLMNENEKSSRSQYYFFTPFALCLNEQLNESFILPLSDCRFRQDIRHLERGETDAASAEKHRLEEQQRAEAKKRDSEFQPLWFRKDHNEEFIYTHEYDQRRFDHCPNLFSQSSER
jgi:hypothetical protein